MKQLVVFLKRKSILFVLLAFASSCGEKQQAPEPPEIPVVKVIQQQVPVTVDFVGQIYGELDIPIRARVKGFLEGIDFQEGSRVDKGQLLYTIDQQEYQTQVARQMSQVAEAQTAFAKAESDLNRIKPLAEINAVSKSDLDAAQANYDAALAYVDAAKANLELSRIQLSYCFVKSPIDGIIGKTNAKVGEFVGQSPNPVILNTVSTIEKVRVEFFLTENDYLKLAREIVERRQKNDSTKAGNKAKIDLILSDGTVHPYEGTLDFINRQVDEETGSLLVQASFDNPDQILRPGQFARVRIEVSENDALLVPQRCLSEMQGQFSLTAVNDSNEVVIKPVKTGGVYKDFRIIKSGVEPGDRIVLEGLQKIRPGMKINPIITDFESTYSDELNK
ncbi:MAG: efflux RND transporter periplasmic adaptor subunit [bacterium]|jgi:membrane fusion protein, multidrug efflux system